MKVIFNNIYEFPITLAREMYIVNSQSRVFGITFEYSEELMDQLEEFFKTTIIENFKILNDNNEQLYYTNKFIVFNRIYTNFINNVNSGIMLELSKKE